MSQFKNFRLIFLLGGIVAAGVAGAWLYHILQNTEETSYSNISTTSYYEYEPNDEELVYRSEDGINFINEDGDIITRDQIEEGDGVFEYIAITGEVFQSIDGMVYFNEAETLAYEVSEAGIWSLTEITDSGSDRGGVPSIDQVTNNTNVVISSGREGYSITPTFGLLTDPQPFLSVLDLEDFDFGDIDGDGDLDVAVGRFLKANQVYLNHNGGYFLIWEETLPETGFALNTSTVEWGDVDGDGDLDLAIATRNGRNVLYHNENGRLEQSPAWTDDRSDRTHDIKWADMNGDGFLDLVVANGSESESHIFLNNTEGTLETDPVWSGLRAQNSVGIDIGHYDDDAALDIAFAVDAASTEAGVVVLQNELNRSGEMTAVSLQDNVMGTVSSVAWGPMTISGTQRLAVADAAQQGDIVLQNNSGQFTRSWQPDRDLTALDAEWGDVNGDGYLDLAIATSANGRERVYLYDERLGDLESTPSWRADGFNHARQLEWADLDNDRDLDLVVHYGDDLAVYVNQLPPLLQNANDNDSVAEGVNSYAIDMADFNQDGFIDIAIGNNSNDGSGSLNQIYLNNGGNLFLDRQIVNVGTSPDETYGVAWADVNSDGILDLGVANGGRTGEANRIYFGQQIGAEISLATTPITLPIEDNSRDLVWGDVDGDGDLDLVVANFQQPNLLYINNGQDSFSDEGFAFGVDDRGVGFKSIRLDLGDIDADGDLDLAVANDGEPNRIYFNNNGRFSDTAFQEFGTNERSYGLDWGDYDGDGQLDLAIANRNGANQLYWNAGGTLWNVPAWESADIDDSHSLAWGDVDGDGDLDLAVANRGGQELFAPIPNKLYLNVNGILQTAREDSLWNSNDRFPSSEARNIQEHLPSFDVAWADTDNDGDIDLVFANGTRILNGEVSLPVVNHVYENDLVPANSNQLNGTESAPGRAAPLACMYE
ncbi:MAG: VCBS repeat-containing protein [Chloroflexota bacterium]